MFQTSPGHLEINSVALALNPQHLLDVWLNCWAPKSRQVQEGWDLDMSLLPSDALDVPLEREFLSLCPKAVKISLRGLDQAQLLVCVCTVLLSCTWIFQGTSSPQLGNTSSNEFYPQSSRWSRQNLSQGGK